MKKLYRNPNGKKIAGVCQGLGEFLDIDPSFLRMGLVFLATLTAVFPLFIAYLLAALIIPKRPKGGRKKEFKKVWTRRLREKKLAGICAGFAFVTTQDVTIVRLLTIILAIFTGILPILVTYISGIFLLPVKKR